MRDDGFCMRCGRRGGRACWRGIGKEGQKRSPLAFLPSFGLRKYRRGMTT